MNPRTTLPPAKRAPPVNTGQLRHVINMHQAVILAQRMRLCQINQGAVLFQVGDTHTDFMAFVLDGEAVVESAGSGNTEAIVLSVLQVGDTIGDVGVVANVPRSATVTASTDMMVAVLDQTAFAQIIKEAPDRTCGLLSTACKT